MRPLRVLLVSNLFPPDVLGGYELLARDVALSLRRREHDVHVLTTGERRVDDPPWVHRELALVRSFDAPPSLDRVAHARIARGQEARTEGLLALGFDCALMMSMRRLGLHAARAITRARIPSLYLFNDDWLLAHRPGEAKTAVRRAVFRAIERAGLGARSWLGVSIERAVYVSEAIRTALVGGGAPVPPGVVCFQGVDRNVFAPRPPRAMSLAPKLLYAGRVHPTKGIDVAIAALATLRRRDGIDASLTIAGTGAAEEIERLERIARDLGVHPHVHFLGFVPRVSLGDVYRSHDVFLFPSLWEEPAGLTYLEAMACGVPVVAVARGGAKEVLRHGENSLIAPEGQQGAEHQALANGLADGVAALVGDADLLARIVRGGESTVRDRASLDRYVDAIERELSAGLGERHAESRHHPNSTDLRRGRGRDAQARG